MSNYHDFIFDFPGRCVEVLRRGTDTMPSRDVTILLMTFTTAFQIPYERLRKKKNEVQDAPESLNHAKAPELCSLLEQPFLGSPLWPYECRKSWQWGNVNMDSYGEGDPVERWLTTTHLYADKSAEHVLSILRNAAAHGKIYARTDKSSQISELVFLNISEGGNPTALVVSPADLRDLLLNWVAFLKSPSVNSGTHSGVRRNRDVR